MKQRNFKNIWNLKQKMNKQQTNIYKLETIGKW